MAYVITAVGAGGKTTYLKTRAQEYLRRGKRVAITTTTHIWPVREDLAMAAEDCFRAGDFSGRSDTVYFGRNKSSGRPGADYNGTIEASGEPCVDYFGTRESSGKLTWPGEEAYARICREYDIVLVEGDGSHCMPAKIPGENEPVVPDNTDEIVVVMGAHAIGRRLDVVCHRYPVYGSSFTAAEDDFGFSGIAGSVPVTEPVLEKLAQQYYLRPLRQQFPKAKISFVISRMSASDGRIAAVLLASGFGRRYGGNKLLDSFQGKPLYRHALDHVTAALGKENTIVVTRYGSLLDQVRREGITAVWNDQAMEGISASIRLGTKTAMEWKADAVMFFVADMPYLPEREIRMFAEQFLASGKPYGCMEFGPKHICTNPGAFRLNKGAEKLLQLTGDRGAMRIMKQEPWNIYYYQIAPKWAEDIDRKD